MGRARSRHSAGWLLSAGVFLAACARAPEEEPGDGSESALLAATDRAAVLPPDSPWASPEACDAAVRAGQRSPRFGAPLRVATWNLRWFPDGGAPSSTFRRPTNVDWLACTLVWLDPDAVVVEEIQDNPAAHAAMERLLARASELSGAQWRIDVDTCAAGELGLHVGFLYDAALVDVRALRPIRWYADSDVMCGTAVRQAFTGAFTFSDGRKVDLVGVHAKAGGEYRSFQQRQRAIARLRDVVTDARAGGASDDVIIAGDFNTMGCVDDTCFSPVAADREIALLGEAASAASMRLVPNRFGCSFASGTKTSLLDHFLVSSRGATASTVEASGTCGALACAADASLGTQRAARELSDHCPVVLDVGVAVHP